MPQNMLAVHWILKPVWGIYQYALLIKLNSSREVWSIKQMALLRHGKIKNCYSQKKKNNGRVILTLPQGQQCIIFQTVNPGERGLLAVLNDSVGMNVLQRRSIYSEKEGLCQGKSVTGIKYLWLPGSVASAHLSMLLKWSTYGYKKLSLDKVIHNMVCQAYLSVTLPWGHANGSISISVSWYLCTHGNGL